jgi:molecular chaperone Hsp33
MLGADEVEGLIEETGRVEMTCEFCNRSFSFDEPDVTRILAGEAPGPTLH